MSTVSPQLPSFIGGMLCLDFANTVDPRHAEDRSDFLRSYGDLVTWSEHAGLLPARLARELERRADANPVGADAVHRRALVLRETVYGLLAPQPSAINDRARPANIKALNQEAHRALAMADLAAGAGRWAWQWRSGPFLDRMLWAVARSATDPLLSGRLDRVRECEGNNGCGWLFLDTSRNGKRRWCDMSVCGNRAKARRYRQHHSAASDTPIAAMPGSPAA